MRFPGNVFPFGTHVYREPHVDMDELAGDLPLLARLGFNMIKIQESWASDEPREGEIDLSRIEHIIAHAAELGLGVYLGVTMEQAPAWVWRKYPDCRLVYADGQPHEDPTQYLLPADGKPGPCWDHPGARGNAEFFITELARRLGRFNNIWAWNTWQEIGFWPNRGGALGFCYCPHTLSAFRFWLHEKYGDLEWLNGAWHTAFGGWDEVQPPRQAAMAPSFIDWRYFMDDVYLTRALAWKTAAFRRADPGRRPVFSHVGGPTIGSGAEWRWATAGDFFGKSNYPAWAAWHQWDDDTARKADRSVTHLTELWTCLQFQADYTRSATGRGRTFWAAEFQGGPISTSLHIGRTPDAEDVRRWVLGGMAAGMNGISFWNHRAEIFWSECNGFGLMDPAGGVSERLEAAGRLARAINEDPEIFSLGEPPQAPVALLVNEDLYHFCQATANDAVQHLQYGLRGHYYRLWRMGVPADFVEAEQAAAGALAGYKAAILPVPLALDAAYMEHLRAYVAGGGMLISDACPGRFDRYGFCPRSQMVAGGEELFGARHERVRIVGEPDGAGRWTPSARGWGEFADPVVLTGTGELEGARLRASFYLQTLSPLAASSVLLAGDETAGTINRFGKGRAALLGTFAGHSALAHRLEGGEDVFEKLLHAAGVEPDVCGPLLRRRRVHGDRQAWFLINPTDAEVTQPVGLEGFRNVRDLLGDAVLETAGGTARVRVPAAGVRCLVLSG
jgi:beta-galactosidase